MSIHDILDDSWLQEQQKIQDIKHNYCKESMDMISVYSIFINNDKNIDKIVNSEITISSNNNDNKYIPKETLLHLIQKNKEYNTNNNKSTYKLLDIASFFVTIEPEYIQSFSKSNDTSFSNDFFKFHHSVDDIIVPQSIFIFHKVNAIFITFQECIQKSNKYTIKSILKTKPNKNTKFSNTKKVQIKTQFNESYNNSYVKHKKTRRNVR